MCIIKLTDYMLTSSTKLIQDMLWLYFLLSDSFTLDAMLKVKPAQTGHSDLLVHELTMEQFASLLQSESGPESECLLIEQKINMLLLQPA
jgi:hypothetical protein